MKGLAYILAEYYHWLCPHCLGRQLNDTRMSIQNYYMQREIIVTPIGLQIKCKGARGGSSAQIL